MIVTIDTGKDSREDILKAIALLRAVVQEGQPETRNIFSDNTPSAPSALGSFFDTAEQAAPAPTNSPASDLIPKDEPKVEFY